MTTFEELQIFVLKSQLYDVVIVKQLLIGRRVKGEELDHQLVPACWFARCWKCGKWKCGRWPLTFDLWSPLKPEELNEDSEPDEAQKSELNENQDWDLRETAGEWLTDGESLCLISAAAEADEKSDATGEEKTDDDTKPANGEADCTPASQSGSNKKVTGICPLFGLVVVVACPLQRAQYLKKRKK